MKNKKLILLIVIVLISIGFAFLTANLTINGNVKFVDSTFNVYLDNVELKNSTATNTNLDLNNDKNVITVSATLQKPGDNFKFSFNVINEGTIEAVLDNFTVSGLPDNLKNYFTYTLTYDFDKSTVSRNDILYAGQARKINFNIEYNYDIDSIPEVDNLSLEIRLNYINPKKLSKTTEWNYSYSGTEQIFYVPKTGTYKLEVWGAAGGNRSKNGAFGGYAVGTIDLIKNEKLYINVGGAGSEPTIPEGGINQTLGGVGGYNGGGNGSNGYNKWPGGSSGGGATHIATVSGLLSSLQTKITEIIIVAGGGGGAVGDDSWHSKRDVPGVGGGFKGGTATLTLVDSKTGESHTNTSEGGTQTAGYKFGQGQSGRVPTGGSFGSEGNGGAGGGFYGGKTSQNTGNYSDVSGGGGSGYIGNSRLKEKAMYCYECEISNEVETKTISVTNKQTSPKSQYAKIGNGFVRITLLESN